MSVQEVINLTLLVLVIFAVLVGIREGRRLKNKRYFFNDMGLKLVDEPDPGLKDRIMGLYPGEERPDIDIFKIHQLRRGNAVIYVMDFISPSDEKRGWFAKNGVAIVSPDLDLPRISLEQKVDLAPKRNPIQKAIRSSMGIIFADRSGSKSTGFRPVSVPDNPELEEKFVVRGVDEEQVQKLLSDPGIVPTLLYDYRYMLEANEDTILIDSLKETWKPEQESIQEDIEQAMRLYELFRNS